MNINKNKQLRYIYLGIMQSIQKPFLLICVTIAEVLAIIILLYSKKLLVSQISIPVLILPFNLVLSFIIDTLFLLIPLACFEKIGKRETIKGEAPLVAAFSSKHLKQYGYPILIRQYKTGNFTVREYMSAIPYNIWLDTRENIFEEMRVNKVLSTIEHGNKSDIVIKTTKRRKGIIYDDVFVGIDAMGNADGKVIESEFSKIINLFHSAYFLKYNDYGNRLEYIFSATGFKPDITDTIERWEYLCAIAESCVYHSMYKIMPQMQPVSNLVTVNLLGDNVFIYIAKNRNGLQENKTFSETLRRKLKETTPLPGIIKENWADNNSKEMTWGYNQKILQETHQKINITLPLETHPHALITGPSGSGKSKALLYLLGRVLFKVSSNMEIYVCDFKNSEDFKFLKGLPHYYTGDDCYRGIREYYDIFQQVRETGTDYPRHLLICDEYPALVNYLQGMDKLHKTHKTDEVLMAISSILMLGRGTANGFGVWIITQRPEANLFKGGSRDNFMVILALGRLSKEQKSMVFPNIADEIPNRSFQKGEGMLLADGHDIQQVKFPLIDNEEDWCAHIRTIMDEKYSVNHCANVGTRPHSD